MVLLAFTVTAHNPITAVLTILVWGAFAFGNVPGLQVYVVSLAEKYTPDAIDVASGLNIAAFNVGIALGSHGVVVTSSQKPVVSTTTSIKTTKTQHTSYFTKTGPHANSGRLT